jgi:hypothetical protein
MGPVVMVLVSVLVQAPADAGPSLELKWAAPDECPMREEVGKKVERALGPSDQDSRTLVHARARIERVEDGKYVLDLVLESEGEKGERQLEGIDCRELADAAALIMAVAIDPSVLERAEPEPEPEPELGPVDLEPIEPVPEVRAATQARRVHLGLDAFAGAGFAILPAPTAVVGLSLGLYGRLWRAEIGGGYWAPTDEINPSNPEVGRRFQLWAVTARGCVAPAVRSVEFPVCVGVDAGAMHGRGTGDLDSGLSVVAPWAAFASGASVRWRPRGLGDWVGFWLRGQALVALVRPGFATQPSGTVHRVPAAGGDVDVGPEVTLVSAGDTSTCACTETSGVRCWGDAASGRLGHGNTDTIGDGETPASAGDVPLF